MAFAPALTPKIAGSTTINPANITTLAVVATTFTAPGARTDNQLVVVNLPSLETNVVIAGARVSAANTIEVRLYNPTGSSIDPASQEVRWMVF